MEENKDNELNLKITIIGDTFVGKTSLFTSYSGDKYKGSTIVFDYTSKKIKNYKNTGLNINFNFFDTAGLEKFKASNTKLYNGSHAIIVMYSIDNKNSFNNTDSWKSEAENYTNDVDFYLVGGKLDLREKNTCKESQNSFVSTVENRKKGYDSNYKNYFEVCCLEKSEELEKIFNVIIEDLCFKILNKTIVPSNNLKMNKKIKKSWYNCC